MNWLSRVLGRKPFTPLEERLLRELQQHLAPDAAKLLAEQVRSINLAQRHSGGREVCFYPMHKGRPERDDALRFPARQRELKLATIQFEVPGQGRVNAEFHLVEGYLFSMEFTPSPGKIKNSDSEVVVRRVEIHRDPMTPSLEPASREKIDAQLPGDYDPTQILGVEGVNVLRLADVYSVVLEDATYYVLAQLEDLGVLGIRKHSHDGMVYLLPFDGPARALGTSFREAVRSSTG